MLVLAAQLCLTLCDPMDWSLPGSSVHGIFQARVLEWGAIAFSEERSLESSYQHLTLLCGVGYSQHKGSLLWLKNVEKMSVSTAPAKPTEQILLTIPYFGEGNGTPLQYSCLENFLDGGAF